MAGSWDFTADSDIQTELSNKLNEAADKYDAKVEAMYSEIDSLGSNNYWVGEDYDAFKTGTEGYKTALQDLSNGIRMYGAHFEAMATGTDTLATELIAIIQNMTGTGGTGSTGSGTPSGGTTSGDTTSGDTPSGGTGNSNDSGQTNDDYIGGNQEAVTGGDAGENADGSQNIEGETQDVEEQGNGNDTASKEEEPESEATYKSGDSVSVNGSTYNFYGGYRKPNGAIVNLFADNSGKLYYQDESGAIQNVTASYIDGSGQPVTSNATIDDVGRKIQMSAHGYPYTASVSLKVDDMTLDQNKIASEVTLSGAANTLTSNNSNAGAYFANDVSYTSDGSVLDSYGDGYDGGTINGDTLVKATEIADFHKHAEDGFVIEVPQGTNLQWDPAWNVTGYDFQTSNGSIYLKWDSSAADGEGAYHLVDEYGNVTLNKDFTLDGFNNNAGHWK